MNYSFVATYTKMKVIYQFRKNLHSEGEQKFTLEMGRHMPSQFLMDLLVPPRPKGSPAMLQDATKAGICLWMPESIQDEVSLWKNARVSTESPKTFQVNWTPQKQEWSWTQQSHQNCDEANQEPRTHSCCHEVEEQEPVNGIPVLPETPQIFISMWLQVAGISVIFRTAGTAYASPSLCRMCSSRSEAWKHHGLHKGSRAASQTCL